MKIAHLSAYLSVHEMVIVCLYVITNDSITFIFTLLLQYMITGCKFLFKTLLRLTFKRKTWWKSDILQKVFRIKIIDVK